MVFGLIGAVVLARGSLRKAIAMVVLGLLLGSDRHRRQFRRRCASPSTFRRSPKASASPRSPWACSASPRSSTTSSSAPRSGRSSPAASAGCCRRLPTLRQCGVVDRARNRARLAARHSAGRRRVAGVVRRLHHREEVRARAEEFWPRRHPRRGRAGSGQQRRRADLVHPDADARRAVQPDHGADDRRADDPGDSARPAGHGATAGIVLGHRRLDVDRKSVSAAAQPAADRTVGAAPGGALPAAVSRPS